MTLHSKHAREQMTERGISVNEIEAAIKLGAKELQLPNKILHHFRYFTVVTRKINKEYFVITVMIRR